MDRHHPRFNLSDFRHLRPGLEMAQRDLARWITNVIGYGANEDDLARVRDEVDYFWCPEDAIARRREVMPDFAETDPRRFVFLDLGEGREGAGWSERSALYRACTDRYFDELYGDAYLNGEPPSSAKLRADPQVFPISSLIPDSRRHTKAAVHSPRAFRHKI